MDEKQEPRMLASMLPLSYVDAWLSQESRSWHRIQAQGPGTNRYPGVSRVVSGQDGVLRVLHMLTAKQIAGHETKCSRLPSVLGNGETVDICPLEGKFDWAFTT